jgi:alpha-methylacyl-CoA racemase
MLLVIGVLAGLWEAQRSGAGQVVDAAMLDGTNVLVQMIWGLMPLGEWADERGANLLDGGAAFYDTYTCADGRYVAVGAIEPQFYAALLAGLGLSADDLPDQMDQTHWPATKARFADVFATRARDEWVKIFADTDACVTPVLAFAEVADHPHVAARASVVQHDGQYQAAPAPRFSRTGTTVPTVDRSPHDAAEILAEWTPDDPCAARPPSRTVPG